MIFCKMYFRHLFSSVLLAALVSCAQVNSTDIPLPPAEESEEEETDPTLEEVAVPIPDAKSDDVKISFTESSAHITNPERGYMSYLDVKSDTDPLNESAVKADRINRRRTLYYLGFYLTDFMNGDISQEYLNKIQSCFDALRAGGSKCVLRFAYKDNEKKSNKPWDPKEEVVMRHIQQLSPLFNKNKDVIFVLQAGFVGVWGEWYFTSNFIYQPESDQDFQPRKRVAEALLKAVPKSRQIELRTPQFKMRMYNLSLKDTLTMDQAHKFTALSRIGSHNDCFGAAYDDWGTYDQEPNDREFWQAETRYTIMGGETCALSDYCTCEVSLKDMEDYHWTYLNSAYNTEVIDRWKKNGCNDQVADRLGYRISLVEVSHSANTKKGEDIRIELKIKNSGFAAPMNPRYARFVHVSRDGKTSRFPVGSDPRTWHSGIRTIVSAIPILEEGGSVYLELSDPLLPDRPEYSIALANDSVFDSKTGYNKLFDL